MAVPAAPAAGEPIAEAWGDVVHAQVVDMEIQVGTVSTTHTNQQTSPQVNVVFPHPFAAPPMVALGCTNFNYAAGLSAPASATGFNISTWRYTGNANGTIATQWIAYGKRA